MKVFFYQATSFFLGSERIHVRNLSEVLKDIGVEARVVNDFASTDCDVMIFSKSAPAEKVIKFKEMRRNVLVGRINPIDYKNDFAEKAYVDFFLTASIVERDRYLKHGKPVLLYPQIEVFSETPKVHFEKSNIRIGYHGNTMHINGMTEDLFRALLRVKDRHSISLHFLYNTQLKDKVTIPDWVSESIDCEHMDWQMETFERDILSFDIGLVPSLTKMSQDAEKAARLAPSGGSGFEGDIVSRYKVTTNAGRAFVFHQLGIPVVADMAPCNFHILGNPDNGYLAMSEEGWFDALDKLCASASHRNEIAENARECFLREYDEKVWARRVATGLERLHEQSVVVRRPGESNELA